jgi:hypothetical protein
MHIKEEILTPVLHIIPYRAQSGLVCIPSMASDICIGIEIVHEWLAMDYVRPLWLFADIVDVPRSNKRGDMKPKEWQIYCQKSNLVRD